MLRSGDIITLAALALLAIGVVMVSSASMRIDPAHAVTLKTVLLSRASFYAILATIAMFAVARLPLAQLVSPDRLARWAPALYAAIVLLLILVFVPPFAMPRNGAYRWMQMPGTAFSFQPSEVAKWGMLLILAAYAVRRAPRLQEFRAGLLPALCILAPVAALIAKEDLGTGVLVFLGGCTILVAGGVRLWHLAMFIPMGLAALVITSPYRMDRITAFLNPYAHPQTDGYHMIQSLVAIANGHGAGRGLGFGLQKFGYLPEDQTDFLFAVICEEMGIAGAALVISAYALIIWIAVGVVARQTHPLLKLVGAGITATFGLQAVINLFVVTGMAPTKGIALPLLSFGGTGWIMTAASLGLLSAMDRFTASAPRPDHVPISAGPSLANPCSPLLSPR